MFAQYEETGDWAMWLDSKDHMLLDHMAARKKKLNVGVLLAEGPSLLKDSLFYKLIL